MNDFYSITLDKAKDIPIYQQLGDALCQLIEEGVLKPNCKLPPIRKMAEALKINNVTVISAYKYLENKKVLYSHVGSGTYVSELYGTNLPEPVTQDRYTSRSDNYDISGAVNFANSSTSKNLFPVSEFKELFNQVLDRDGGGAFGYQDSQGYESLRISICKYLEGCGIKASYDRIHIISGSQQGFDIVSKVLLGAGDVIFVEKPTYYGAVGAFLSRGGQVVEIDMEKDGIDMDKLECLLKIYRPKFIYVMTYFQTPTSASYSTQKKRRLLDLAAKYDMYIVEEDNQNDFNYSTDTVTPLKALDYKNRVIYIKSFSKILMPGLRLGFMAMPKKISRQAVAVKQNTDISTSGFIQRAFDLYISGNGWEKHVGKMREIFKERYVQAGKAIDYYLKNHTDYTNPQGGLSYWLKLKNTVSANNLCNELIKKNVIVTPGSVFSTSGEDIPYIRISFADVEKDMIEKGIKIIGQLLDSK